MRKFSLHRKQSDAEIRSSQTERISHRVLYSLTAFTAVVFLLFYFVGYDNIVVLDDQEYVYPLLTDLLMMLMILLLVGTFIVACCSKWYSVRTNHTPAIVNGIHGKKITLGVTIGTIIMMAVLYALPSGEVLVNGDKFTEQIWLRMANMFVVASGLLIIIGIAAIVFGIVRNRRRR